MTSPSDVDLTAAREIVNGALQTIEGYDPLVASLKSTPVRTQVADAGRSLLNLADQLALAASLVRNEYWGLKGEVSYEL